MSRDSRRSVEYVDMKEPEPAETGVYSKKVQGKLWLEGFAGPSSYDLDRFGYEYRNVYGDVSANLDLAPRVKGPEFGGAISGALSLPWVTP